MGKTKSQRIHNSYYYCYQNVNGRQVTSSSKLESPCTVRSLLGKRGVISVCVASAGSFCLSSGCTKSSESDSSVSSFSSSSSSSSSSFSSLSSSVLCAFLHETHEYIKKLHNYCMFFTTRKS